MSPLSAILLAAALSAGDVDPRDKGPSSIDVSSYPAEQQARYRIFSAKCSKCHTLARPLNADFDTKYWKVYVRKMIRRTDSGINEEMGEEIYWFLKFYSERKAGR